ncbi:MAG TPA: hypothetical protein VFG23_25435 [Polyangia bacterium]|nr:hypothetical protein [Polyangia bacterium]
MSRVIPGWRIGALVAALLTVIAARPARAQDRDQRELEAKKACLGGHADKGIELLADLYADTNDPTYIYNQGRCFEQNGRAGEAIARFREYLRKATALAPDERAQLQKHIDELEAEAKTDPGASPSPSGAPASGAITPVPSSGGVVSAAPGPTPERARQLRIAGLITGGVGVLAVAGGVAMGLRARSLSSEVTSDANAGNFSQGKFDSGEHAQTLEVVGYAVGAAALIGGGLLYYLGSHHDDRGEVTPAVGVAFDRTGAGATLRMAF